jgi:hypothetical protein
MLLFVSKVKTQACGGTPALFELVPLSFVWWYMFKKYSTFVKI